MVCLASTYGDLYLDARRALRLAGVEAAALEAREIVCFAAGKSREQFYRDRPLYASAQVEEQVAALLERRLGGEPVAYLIGEWEFYGLPLEIGRDVLIPRMDTEVLAERAILRARAAGAHARVLDLCAGSGCVGLAVAANAPECRVILAELSEGALQVAKGNIRRNGLTARMSCVRADALAPPVPALGEFDVIASNPPYIPTGDLPGLDRSVRCYEPALALDGGEDGLDFYRAIAGQWGRALRPGGRLLFEVGQGQARAVAALMTQNGFQDLEIWRDTAGIERVVEGRLPPGSPPAAPEDA